MFPRRSPVSAALYNPPQHRTTTGRPRSTTFRNVWQPYSVGVTQLLHKPRSCIHRASGTDSMGEGSWGLGESWG